MVARALCCLLALGHAGAIYSPPDIDFDQVEIWPLSGGVRDGVNVRVTANAIKSDDTAIIDFLTANYEVAFRFEVDTVNRMVKRNAAPGDAWGIEQTRGGWPFADDLNTPTTMNFVKGINGWAITIDGVRAPWLDFTHVHPDAVVFAAVYTGFEEGEVVDSRPQCSVQCHPEECSGGCDDSGSGCFSRLPSQGDDNSASCTAEQTTGPAGVQCCEGRQLNTVSGALQVGDWVRIFTDADAVSNACDALIGAAGNCSDAAGHKVEIMSTLVGNSYDVYVPQRWDQATSVISMPPDVMQAAPLTDRLLDVTPAVTNAISRDDATIGLVTAVGPAAEGAGVKQWDYINMLTIPCSFLDDTGYGSACVTEDGWWMSYSESLWGGLRPLITKIWFQDEIRDHTGCVDESQWVDSLNNTCQSYVANAWCEDHGIATTDFVNQTGATSLEDLKVGAGWHAAHMCCLCGGGFHDPPPSRTIYQ